VERFETEVEYRVSFIEQSFPKEIAADTESSWDVAVGFSSSVFEAVELGSLKIVKSDESIYFEKSLEEMDFYEVVRSSEKVINGESRYMISFENVDLEIDEMFEGGFEIGSFEKIRFVLDFEFKGKMYEEEVEHEIKIVDVPDWRKGIW
jgi:hypothetical protein